MTELTKTETLQKFTTAPYLILKIDRPLDTIVIPDQEIKISLDTSLYLIGVIAYLGEETFQLSSSRVSPSSSSSSSRPAVSIPSPRVRGHWIGYLLYHGEWYYYNDVKVRTHPIMDILSYDMMVEQVGKAGKLYFYTMQRANYYE